MNRKLILVGTLIFVSAYSFGQTAGSTIPQFGSDEEKAKWIKEHPEEYAPFKGENVQQEAQTVEFSSDAEKSRYIKDNGLGQVTTVLEDLPGFPKYIDTGNPEQDKADYAYRKDLWVEQNRELYDQYTKAPQENLTREERLQKGEVITRN